MWSEWSLLNTKSITGLQDLGSLLKPCSTCVCDGAMPNPVQPSGSTQEEEEDEEEAERSSDFVMSVFLSHFHKTCTGEGKAFQ